MCTACAFTPARKFPLAVVDQEIFEQLLPFAYEWAKTQEEFVLAKGVPLGPRHTADARQAGVDEISRIRLLVVDRIPPPENEELALIASRMGIITEDTRCMGFGYALVVRADAWNDRELILHNLIHIAQCERTGGLKQWIRCYLTDRTSCANFTIGSLEQEARRLAREICSADVAA